MSLFKEYVGIDYSGAARPDSPCDGLRVYLATAKSSPEEILTQEVRRARRWTRISVAHWLLSRCRSGQPLIVGIDHAFSFPNSYLVRRSVTTWDGFLEDFCQHWPTGQKTVEECRHGNPCSGQANEFRLTERWTSSAKSVFLFDVQGSVAKSTHSGLPWIRWLRSEVKDAVHFWPFDGWRVPEGKTVIAEVYPSLFRNRVPNEGRTGDQQDAFATAEWLRTRDQLGFLGAYFTPRHSEEERRVASVEGWILGVA